MLQRQVIAIGKRQEIAFGHVIHNSNRTGEYFGFLGTVCERFKIKSVKVAPGAACLEFSKNSRTIAVKLGAVVFFSQPDLIECQARSGRKSRNCFTTVRPSHGS